MCGLYGLRNFQHEIRSARFNQSKWGWGGGRKGNTSYASARSNIQHISSGNKGVMASKGDRIWSSTMSPLSRRGSPIYRGAHDLVEARQNKAAFGEPQERSLRLAA